MTDRRNTKAAKHFLGTPKALADRHPRVINIDRNPAYGEAIAAPKKEGVIPKELEHRQAKDLQRTCSG